MKDFLASDKEKALQQVVDNLYRRLEIIRQDTTIIDPNPEWYNHHDYSSGRHKGQQLAVKDEISFLESLLDKIERS